MRQILLILLLGVVTLGAIEIKQKPIIFTPERVAMTKKYIKEHYDLEVKNIEIIPKIILVHHTGIDTFERSYKRFYEAKLPGDRGDIAKASALNVSAHYMVDTDGAIYQLMPDNWMARHVIGLNYSAIGIENVGGEGFKNNLTVEQLIANVELINHLKKKYDSLEYVVGHYEYQCFEGHELWLEKDAGYRTEKHDPHPTFMRDIRGNIQGFKGALCDK